MSHSLPSAGIGGDRRFGLGLGQTT